jgi:hypothetical protein
LLAVSAQEHAERIVNKVPKHVPLKIEIVNNDFDSKLEDAIIKVTNTSKKPVYYLALDLSASEDFPKIEGHRIGLSSLNFGTRRLSDVSKLANGDEESLKPGDSITFDIDDRDARLFIKLLEEKEITEAPRLILRFQVLSSGTARVS